MVTTPPSFADFHPSANKTIVPRQRDMRESDGMARFAYFVYRGTFPPSIYSSEPKLYRYIVEVSKKESDGSDRSVSALQRSVRILLRNSVKTDDAYGQDLVDVIMASPPQEITQEEFKSMETRPLNPTSTMPGDVYRVVEFGR